MKSDVVLDAGESYLTRLKYNVEKGKVRGKWMPLFYLLSNLSMRMQQTRGNVFDVEVRFQEKYLE